MKKFKVICIANGVDSEIEAEIDVESLQHSARDRMVFDQGVGRQLIGLLGSGYGDRHFTLVDGDMAFTECRVLKMGADCTISYMRVGPCPPLEPVVVVIPTTS
jgi:hypothetical protein